MKLQSDLGNSNYFSRVEVNAPPDAGDDTAPVNVELDPGKQRKYSVGLGYGTDTGFRGKLRAEQRWLNPQGHHYEAELGYSQIKSLIGFKYMIPGTDPTTDEYAITAGYVRQNYDDKDYETYKVGGSLQQQDGKWLKNYNLNLQYDEYTIGNQPLEQSLLLIPGELDLGGRRRPCLSPPWPAVRLRAARRIDGAAVGHQLPARAVATSLDLRFERCQPAARPRQPRSHGGR